MDLRVMEIAEHYGRVSQDAKLKEELAELAEAIDGGMFDHCAEEIADVQIMLWQIIYLNNMQPVVDEYIEEKLNRQIKRIEEEEKRK